MAFLAFMAFITFKMAFIAFKSNRLSWPSSLLVGRLINHSAQQWMPVKLSNWWPLWPWPIGWWIGLNSKFKGFSKDGCGMMWKWDNRSPPTSLPLTFCPSSPCGVRWFWMAVGPIDKNKPPEIFGMTFDWVVRSSWCHGSVNPRRPSHLLILLQLRRLHRLLCLG